jgi:hypothetical protein
LFPVPEKGIFNFSLIERLGCKFYVLPIRKRAMNASKMYQNVSHNSLVNDGNAQFLYFSSPALSHPELELMAGVTVLRVLRRRLRIQLPATDRALVLRLY